MTSGPEVEARADQSYIAIRTQVTMDTVAAAADRIPEVIGWLGARGIEPAGAPFLKYDVIGVQRRLDIEAGVPVAGLVAPAGGFVAGVLPAGRYVTVSHVGHPAGLLDVTASLLDWAAERGLRLDMSETGGAQKWGCRLEIYKTNPAEEPDPAKWQTEIAFRLAD